MPVKKVTPRKKIERLKKNVRLELKKADYRELSASAGKKSVAGKRHARKPFTVEFNVVRNGEVTGVVDTSIRKLHSSLAKELKVKPGVKNLTINQFRPQREKTGIKGSGEEERSLQKRKLTSTGLGSVALKKTLTQAKKLGCKTVTFYTNNPRMAKIGEKQGFKFLGLSGNMKVYGKKIKKVRSGEKHEAVKKKSE